MSFCLYLIFLNAWYVGVRIILLQHISEMWRTTVVKLAWIILQLPRAPQIPLSRYWVEKVPDHSTLACISKVLLCQGLELRGFRYYVLVNMLKKKNVGKQYGFWKKSMDYGDCFSYLWVIFFAVRVNSLSQTVFLLIFQSASWYCPQLWNSNWSFHLLLVFYLTVNRLFLYFVGCKLLNKASSYSE